METRTDTNPALANSSQNEQRNKKKDKFKENKGYPYKKLHLHRINNKKQKQDL